MMRDYFEPNSWLIPAHAGKTAERPSTGTETSAHPRSRGENCVRLRGDPDARGSSPLTRGKRTGAPCQVMPAGLIPAHAGKTPAARRSATWPTAHPRSRGENGQRSAAYFASQGSSPLTRGKLSSLSDCECNPGLIPAHAGKTQYKKTVYQVYAAHPRSRGENCEAWRMTTPDRGSSPLTRGKPVARPSHPALMRLIPAHAGKTDRLVQDLPPARAHPRSRGENGSKAAPVTIAGGSSPRGRGKRDAGSERVRRCGLIPAWAGKTPPGWASARCRSRLIPAWAGKTSGCPSTRSEYRAHPRVGGENLEDNWGVLEADGSSPRGRGKLAREAATSTSTRLIPAWAGKTISCSFSFAFASAHPRVGGENLVTTGSYDGNLGSSPRGRGKPAAVMRRTRRTRLIPAWAGKTCGGVPRSHTCGAHPRVGGENLLMA